MLRSSCALLLALAFSACATAKPTPAARPKGGEARTEVSAQYAPAIPAQHADREHTSKEHTMQSWSLEKLASGAVLLGDLGQVHRTVSTHSKDAQAFFDQGLALTYGFNHDEAARSFAHAAMIDPSCALCFWGAAYTLGPNYNIPMLPERAAAAWDALTRAREAQEQATPAERALIEALSHRYQGPEYVDPGTMRDYNIAYAEAMRDVAVRFSADDDIQTLFAEAQMDIDPWKLWSSDGTPAQHTEEIVRTLETVLARSPNHPGANHYYIHAVEASKDPGRAIASADRLGSLVPGAGHIVHMPAHIYQRVGRYADASAANRRAIEVDQRYLARVEPPGYYPFYLGHNFGFLAYSSSMLGRSAESLASARRAAASIPRDVVCGMPGMDFFLAEPILVMVRFGMWDPLLTEPKPDDKYAVLNGLWHHGRGMALAAKGRSDEARAEAEAIRKIAAALPPELSADLNSARDVLTLAALVIDARVADSQKSPDAIEQWQQAVAQEDALAYSEPADWFYPVRHYLGAALLEAGKAREAEAVYRADLARNPHNGWALFGLSAALRAQKRTREANETERAFNEAFKEADIVLSRSAF